MTQATFSGDAPGSPTGASRVLRWMETLLSPDTDTRARLRRAARTLQDGSLDALVKMAQLAGARATVTELTLREAVQKSTADDPLVFETPRGLVALHGPKWFGALVRAADDGEPARVSIADLVALAEANGADAPMRFASLSLDRPLRALASPDEPPTPGARLVSLTRLDGADVLAVMSFAALEGLLALAAPIAVQGIVVNAAFGTLLQPLLVLTGGLFVTLSLSMYLRLAKHRLVERLNERVVVRFAMELGERFPRLSQSARGTHEPSDLSHRFFDVFIVQKTASTLLLDGLGVALTLVFGSVLLAFYHPMLLVFDLVLLCGVAFVVLGLGGGAIETSVKESKAKHALGSELARILRSPGLFSSRPGAELAHERIDDLCRGWLGARRAHFRILYRQIAASIGLHVLASASLLGVGGLLVTMRQLSLGQLVAAEILVTAMVLSVSKVGKLLEAYYDLLASLDKASTLLDLPIEDDAGECVVLAEGPLPLAIDGLVVQDDRAPVSSVVAAGGSLAITGPIASGKSRLLSAIAGRVEPKAGTVRLGGVPIRELPGLDVRSKITWMTTFEPAGGTLLDEARALWPDATLDEVRSALELVGLGNTIDRLADGAQTRLGAGGAPLSDSELVRLAIARAVVARAGVICVDGMLDCVPAAQFRELVAKLRARVTLVVVTQRPELAAALDASVCLSTEEDR